MKCCIVGGWVRDRLLSEEGYPVRPNDRDWVVVGATPEDMTKKGFIPVGRDFPVFLHPDTHEEYALARTERKTSKGYHGFVFFTSPEITLEEDLLRRDLTINAMAIDEDGSLVDPYGGKEDLKNRILRHVSDAFSEDPVRILRLARFRAKFPDFSTAPETMELLKSMVDAGEADALTPERIHQEISKGLESARPSKMMEVLFECGFWARIFPNSPVGKRSLRLIDQACRSALSLSARFAALTFDMSSDQATEFLNRIRASSQEIDSSTVIGILRRFTARGCSSSDALSRLFLETDVARRPERFLEALKFFDSLELPLPFSKEELTEMTSCWRSIDAGSIAAECADKSKIKQAVLEARCSALSDHLAYKKHCASQNKSAHKRNLDPSSPE